MEWNQKLNRSWRNIKPALLKSQPRSLIRAIQLLAKYFPSKHRNALPGQPFDSHLLSLSSLYRHSRQIYMKGQGYFVPTLVSSPRTLSSPALLQNRIEYSPIEQEFIWSATDLLQRRNLSHILTLRSYASNPFHEQNHRILWRTLPPAPQSLSGMRRYLNFVESLVIAMDMALSDELGPCLASLFHLCGVTYDPGTDIKTTVNKKRLYRNYLQAAMYGTYLNLELYDLKEIPKAIRYLFPNLGELGERAAQRSCNLDREFVLTTNPRWQKLHRKLVSKHLSHPGENTLSIKDDPLDNCVQYLWMEKWLDSMNL